MTTDGRFDELISRWLEETAQARVPDRVLDATFARTHGSRQQVGWRAILKRIHAAQSVRALSGAAVVVFAVALALGLYGNQWGVGGQATPGVPFAGNWTSTDLPPDSSHLTMEVAKLRNGTYHLTIRDDHASVCDGASSTMTGVAEARQPDRIVIAQPEYTCDDGTKAQALSGPPLAQQLQNLGFTYHAARDELEDSGGLVWTRVAMGP